MPATAQKKTPAPALGRKKKLPTQIAAAQAKANLLQMIASVNEAGEYIITKRGKPVAKLIPFEVRPKKDIYGCMAGTVTILGDIMEPLPPEEWGSLY